MISMGSMREMLTANHPLPMPGMATSLDFFDGLSYRYY
jgi:hypothetical protein